MPSKRAFFISCVSSEFSSYRDKLSALLTSQRIEIHIQERFRVSGGSLLEKLDDYIQSCDCVVHLVGEGRGQLAKEPETRQTLARNPGLEAMLKEAAGIAKSDPLPAFSYTQWEAYLAFYHRVPCFVFVAAATTPREPGWRLMPHDLVSQQGHMARIKALGKDRAAFNLVEPAQVAAEVLHDMVGQLEAEVRSLSGELAVPMGPVEEKSIKHMRAGGGGEFCDFDGAPPMVVVPNGACFVGSPTDEAGRWSDGRESGRMVRFPDPFAISASPITARQFSLFVERTGHAARGAYVFQDGRLGFIESASWETIGLRPDDPVVCVNWQDAKAYVSWLSAVVGRRYRLPTESEWEYAARAGTSLPFSFESGVSAGNVLFTGADRSPTGPEDPRGFPANAWGLFGVHGNVWEWCADTWRENHSLAPSNGHHPYEQGVTKRRVVRGGSWFDELRFARSASRDHMPETYRASNVGYRVVREL